MKRDPNIDMVKGLAILSIVLKHSLDPDTARFLPLGLTVFRALPVFMVLVGFNGARSYMRRGWTRIGQCYDLRYLWKKMIRIIRPFLVVFIFEAIFATFIVTGRGETWGTVAKAFISGGWGPGSYFIPVVIQLLLLLPLVYLALERNLAGGLLAFLAVDLSIEAILYLSHVDAAVYRLTSFRYFFAVSLGVFLALRPAKNWIFLAVGSLTGFLYMLALNTGHAGVIAALGWPTHKAPVYVYDLMVVSLLLSSLPRADMSWLSRMFRYLGKASYHIFLVQMAYFFVFGILFDHYWGIRLRVDPRFIPLNLVLCCSMGSAFYRLDTKGIIAGSLSRRGDGIEG